MARARHPPPQSTGIISNVLGYFQREYDTFVATATGAPLPDNSIKPAEEDDDEVAHPSSLAAELERATHGWASAGTKRSAERSPERQNKARRHGPSSLASTPERDFQSQSTQPNSDDDHDSTPRQHPPPSTKPAHTPAPSNSNVFTARRQRRLSVTMPGSLFPRSESLEPEVPAPAAAPSLARHVSFAATPVEVSRRYRTNDNSEGGPSQGPVPFSEAELELDGVPPEQDSPLLTRGAKSVKTAVGQFHLDEDEADTSIMLPNPSLSPVRTAAEHSPVRSPKRTAPATEASPGDAALPVRLDKGKGRATEDPFLDLDPNVSGVIRYRGKQKELDDARAEFRQHEERRGHADHEHQVKGPHEQDKRRIQMLEREIETLKAELAKRPTHAAVPDTSVLATPSAPPAPPPPPPNFSTPIPVRDPNQGTDMILNAVRASLRHAGTPIEAPINGPGYGARLKHTGQPTVKIANDQMATFLKEMKSVKLRRVGDASFANNSVLDARPAQNDEPSLRRRATVADLRNQANGSELSRRRSTTDLANATIDHLPPARYRDKGKGRAVEPANITIDHVPAPRPRHAPSTTVPRPQPAPPVTRTSRPTASVQPPQPQAGPSNISKPASQNPISRPSKAVPVPPGESSTLTKPVAVARTQQKKAPDYGNLTVDHVAPPRRRPTADVDRANVTMDQPAVGEKRKRTADDSKTSREDGRRRPPFAIQPVAKPGSKAVRKPARVVPAGDAPPSTALSSSTNGGPRLVAPRLYPMPPPIAPSTSAPPVRPSASQAITDPTPSLTSDNGASPDAEPLDPLATPPAVVKHQRPVPHLDLLKLAGHSGAKSGVLPLQSTVPRVSRGKRLSGDGKGFEARPPQSPILITTPRRPLPPARRSISQQSRDASNGSIVTPDGLDLDERYQLKRPTRLSTQASQPPPYRQPSPLHNTLGLDTFPSDDFMDEGNGALARRPSTGRLADEFARATSSSPNHDEYAELDLDSGVLVGFGTRSKRRGFLARGGAGGPSVFMGKGYVDGAIDSDEETAELEEQYRAQMQAMTAQRTNPNRR